MEGKLFSPVCVLPAELCARQRKSEFIFRGLPLLTMEMMAAAGRVLRREQMCGSWLMSLNSPNFTDKKGNCLL